MGSEEQQKFADAYLPSDEEPPDSEKSLSETDTAADSSDASSENLNISCDLSSDEDDIHHDFRDLDVSNIDVTLKDDQDQCEFFILFLYHYIISERFF